DVQGIHSRMRSQLDRGDGRVTGGRPADAEREPDGRAERERDVRAANGDPLDVPEFIPPQ
ncbi:MAG: hypothetical protein JO169_11185, partial [Solirubrobacterales bacterium]|nr:hypothetical protein [Solirubrobacterales bacterium]